MEIIKKKDLRFFLYILIDLIIIFSVNFYYLHTGEVILYALLIVVSSFIIFFTKDYIGRILNIEVSGEFWIAGLIFSAIATLIASSFGVPIPIPIISYNKYKRKTTLKGIKKGEVKVHEKWEITFLSSATLLFVAFIFISLWHYFNQNAFLISGVTLALFVLIDFLPERRFNGVNLIYHNSIIYSITFMFILLIGIFSIINYIISFILFIIAIIFVLVTYLTKLW